MEREQPRGSGAHGDTEPAKLVLQIPSMQNSDHIQLNAKKMLWKHLAA